MLDIGGSIGALIVHTPPTWAGAEIELAKRGETQQFVHTEVRERRLPDCEVYAAVFVEVPEGKYTLLGAPPGTRTDVVVRAAACHASALVVICAVVATVRICE